MTDVAAGDVVTYIDMGSYTRVVKSVAKKTIMVEQPHGLKPPTKRINCTAIKECWRRDPQS